LLCKHEAGELVTALAAIELHQVKRSR